MEEIIRIFDELEREGWVCVLKWDGERSSRRKTLVVSKAAEDKVYRGDFDDFNQANEHLKKWLKQHSMPHRHSN